MSLQSIFLIQTNTYRPFFHKNMGFFLIAVLMSFELLPGVSVSEDSQLIRYALMKSQYCLV